MAPAECKQSEQDAEMMCDDHLFIIMYELIMLCVK